MWPSNLNNDELPQPRRLSWLVHCEGQFREAFVEAAAGFGLNQVKELHAETLGYVSKNPSQFVAPAQ